MSRRRMLGTALVLEGGMLVLGVALRARFDLAREAPLGFSTRTLGLGIVMTVPLLAFLLWSSRTQWGPLRRLHARVLDMVGVLFRDATVMDAAVVAVLAGLGEEALFRGVLQAWLTRLGGFWLGWLVASLAFGLVHMVTLTYVVVVVGVGLYLGALLPAFDSLVVPIVVHALFDFVALLYLRRLAPVSPDTGAPSG